MHKSFKKSILFGVWTIGIATFFYYYISSGVTFDVCPDAFCGWIQHIGVWGPLIFIALFVLRTLTFFSVTVFVIAAGVLFEPAQAIFYVTIGINLSALLAFGVGRYFGREIIARAGQKMKYFPSGDKFREHGFLSILFMYLLFFPFDWVGYLAGAYGVRLRDMFLGTLLGTFPGLVAFIFLGRIFDNPLVNVTLFVVFFGSGFLLNRVLRKTKWGKQLYSTKKAKVPLRKK